MPLRPDVIQGLQKRIDDHQILPIPRGARRRAREKLVTARDAYQEARREVLELEFPRDFRITIFGSARLGSDTPEYQFVSNLAEALVLARDVDTVTGGGPGIMLAAPEGSRRAVEKARKDGKDPHSRNHGLGIVIPTEQGLNPHTDIGTIHDEFSTRLQEFLDRTHAAYVAPGGFGTLLEFAWILQHLQIGHLEEDYRLIVHPMWQDAYNDLVNKMYHDRITKGEKPLINEQDLSLVKFSDDIGEIVQMVSERYDNWRARFKDHVRLIPAEGS